MLPWKRSPSLRGVMAAERGRHFKPGFAGRPGHPHALQYVRRGGDKTPAIKRPPRRPSLNLTWRLRMLTGKTGGGGRGRAGERAPCVKESHYSVMDCICHTVRALFITPKRRVHFPTQVKFTKGWWHLGNNAEGSRLLLRFTSLIE